MSARGEVPLRSAAFRGSDCTATKKKNVSHSFKVTTGNAVCPLCQECPLSGHLKYVSWFRLIGPG